MGDAIVPITSLCLLGSRTGETDPIDGKPLDDRRTGPAYAAAERMEIDLSATVGAGRRRRDGTVTAPPASLPPELKRSRNTTTMPRQTATPKKASRRARAALRQGRAPRSGGFHLHGGGLMGMVQGKIWRLSFTGPLSPRRQTPLYRGTGQLP
ncbi:hypothetical protein P0O24_07745 [Methanotrichaceae archaeon M04Ac]|jgi:hypothetical protein|uniref:Uncharacterized protein n=1 Tax=Candidatus Methanocrinis alkalitolerans TaxID=3033395 RepID=A0ABT5XFS3_9EURY|nr:hypothetical protein [Candidatus Methanocrinis alkalitolerans]MDF0593473.1 hypothetical protein [Candidatus Methanocrinis alkalitolerans]